MKGYTRMVKEMLEQCYKDSKLSINEVTKNNGLKLMGITIMDNKSNIAPTIYLNDYYKQYQTGKLCRIYVMPLRIYMKKIRVLRILMSAVLRTLIQSNRKFALNW